MPEPIASPCIKLCTLRPDKVCAGCGRTLDEIAAWSQAGETRRAEIVEHARRRLAELTENKT